MLLRGAFLARGACRQTALGCAATAHFSTMTQVADLQTAKTRISDDVSARIKDKGLLKSAGLIAGEWREALDGTTFEVRLRLHPLLPCFSRYRALGDLIRQVHVHSMQTIHTLFESWRLRVSKCIAVLPPANSSPPPFATGQEPGYRQDAGNDAVHEGRGYEGCCGRRALGLSPVESAHGQRAGRSAAKVPFNILAALIALRSRVVYDRCTANELAVKRAMSWFSPGCLLSLQCGSIKALQQPERLPTAPHERCFSAHLEARVPTHALHLYTCRWHDEIVKAADDIAVLMTMECGKPLAEAKAEIASGGLHCCVWQHSSRCLCLVRTMKKAVRMIAAGAMPQLEAGRIALYCMHRAPFLRQPAAFW